MCIRCAYGTLENRGVNSGLPPINMVFFAAESGRFHRHTLKAMSTPPPTEFRPVAGIAAAIFPGAGHFVLGRPKRAFLAMIGVMGLFFFGLLLGGIDAIDSKQDKFWYWGQSLVGSPTLIVNFIHQSKFKAYDLDSNMLRTGEPGEHRIVQNGRPVWEPLTYEEIEAGMGPPNAPGLGRLNEIAMLSIVLAGMLNLIVFLDALMPGPDRDAKNRSPKPASSVSSAGGRQ